jgi:hypothetical protein
VDLKERETSFVHRVVVAPIAGSMATFILAISSVMTMAETLALR